MCKTFHGPFRTLVYSTFPFIMAIVQVPIFEGACVHSRRGPALAQQAETGGTQNMSRIASLNGLRVTRYGVVAFVVLLLTLTGARAARADIFTPGEFVSNGQGDWVSIPAAIDLLENDFGSV